MYVKYNVLWSRNIKKGGLYFYTVSFILRSKSQVVMVFSLSSVSFTYLAQIHDDNNL